MNYPPDGVWITYVDLLNRAANHAGRLDEDPAWGDPELVRELIAAIEQLQAMVREAEAALEHFAINQRKERERAEQAEARLAFLENEWEKLGAVLREKDFQLSQVKELTRNIEHWFEVLHGVYDAAQRKEGK